MISKYSIAVLPFVNMSSDPENEYFSDGITEEILNALCKIDGLHVTARTSSFAFKNQSMDVREIGKKLNVSLILEGSIRKSGEQVRITAQLIKAEDGYHIWTDTWDRELKSIFIVQDEISAIIAEKINADVRPEVPGTGHVLKNLDALDYYLKGNYLLNTWDFSQGHNMIANFEKAIEMDPELIQAYVSLSHCYTWLGSTGVVTPREAHQKVEECISKVLELDPNLPDIYAVIAGKNYWIEWDIARALENIDKALELKPSFPDALQYQGIIRAAAGQVEQALDSLFQVERLNPMSNQVNFAIGLIYNYTNEHTKALEYTNRNIEIFPGWYAQYMIKVEVLCKMKRFEEAREVIRMVGKDPNNPLNIDELNALIHAYEGMRAEATELLMELGKYVRENLPREAPSFYFLASINLLIGNHDKALEYIELGIQYGSTPFLFVKVDSVWDELRNHPRFVKATERIRYPAEDPDRRKARKKYRKAALDRSRADQIEKDLHNLMTGERPWLNPTLNLSDLAEMLDISPHVLSQLLNEFIGKNFYDYVNGYRLDYFLDLAGKKESRQFTLLSLAYDCGFNSKTTFNSFFKRTTGKTPSEYFKGSIFLQ